MRSLNYDNDIHTFLTKHNKLHDLRRLMQKKPNNINARKQSKQHYNYLPVMNKLLFMVKNMNCIRSSAVRVSESRLSSVMRTKRMQHKIYRYQHSISKNLFGNATAFLQYAVCYTSFSINLSVKRIAARSRLQIQRRAIVSREC